MSRYAVIWHEIKLKGYAEVTVSKEAAPALEDNVKHIKSAENTAVKAVGGLGWSKLVLTRTKLSETMLRIRFELLYRTDL